MDKLIAKYTALAAEYARRLCSGEPFPERSKMWEELSSLRSRMGLEPLPRRCDHE